MTAGHPYAHAFVVQEAKVTRYLFGAHSRDGAPKSGFLLRFGFSPDRTLEIMDALLRHPSVETCP